MIFENFNLNLATKCFWLKDTLCRQFNWIQKSSSAHTRLIKKDLMTDSILTKWYVGLFKAG